VAEENHAVLAGGRSTERGVVAAVPPELAEVVAEHRNSRGAILVERRESGGGNAWRRHGFPARLSGEGGHRQQGHDDACDDWVAHGPESITNAGFGRLCGWRERQRAMRPVPVVAIREHCKDPFEMRLIHDEEPV